MNTHASLGMEKMFDRFDISAKVYAVTSGIETAFKSVTQLIKTWAERSKSRLALSHMNDRLLEDIGVTRAEARYESNKPFWKV